MAVTVMASSTCQRQWPTSPYTRGWAWAWWPPMRRCPVWRWRGPEAAYDACAAVALAAAADHDSQQCELDEVECRLVVGFNHLYMTWSKRQEFLLFFSTLSISVDVCCNVIAHILFIQWKATHYIFLKKKTERNNLMLYRTMMQERRPIY